MTTLQAQKRKDRPCDACRKRKSRCVIEDDQSICVLCRFHSQSCTFVETPQARKRKAPVEHGVEDGDEISKRRQSVVSGGSRGGGGHARIIRTNNGTGVEEYDELDGPSLLKKTLGLQNRHHSQYIGATRGLEPALLGEPRTNGKDEIPLHDATLRRVTSSEAFLVLPDPGTQGYTEELDDLDAIEEIVKPHGKALVDIYFRVVFPSFPILHKEVYLEKYSRSYREFSPPLLAAVYLLALYYWSYDDALNKHKKPNVKELENLARKALGDTIHRPKLSTVQAGLLLLQHTDADFAELTAQMISVAYGLGLHLDASDWNIPHWEKGLRKRLGWALYMQDKWSSLGSGRPALINASNWDLQAVTNDDFPENAAHENEREGSSEVEKGRILFSYMITLSIILAELLETVFSVRATREIRQASPNGLAVLLEKIKPVQLRLKEWYATLPECLSMDATPITKLNSIGYLRLAYVATEITLHRRIMLALGPSTPLQLQEICRSVAQERFVFAIDFIQSLKAQHLTSFWYFASPQNFALIAVFGTLLLSTSKSKDEEDFYRTKLREYRWILKMNTENGARYMGPAMKLLDANMTLMKEGKAAHSAKPAHAIMPTPIPASLENMVPPPTHDNLSSAGSYNEDSPNSMNQQFGQERKSPSQFSYSTPFGTGTLQTTEGMNTPLQASGLGIGGEGNGTHGLGFEYGLDIGDNGWF